MGVGGGGGGGWGEGVVLRKTEKVNSARCGNWQEIKNELEGGRCELLISGRMPGAVLHLPGSRVQQKVCRWWVGG